MGHSHPDGVTILGDTTDTVVEHAKVTSSLAAAGPLERLGVSWKSEGEEEESEEGGEHGERWEVIEGEEVWSSSERGLRFQSLDRCEVLGTRVCRSVSVESK